MTPDIGLANWFRQRALRSPGRKALYFEGRTWTYAQMQAEIEDCAARLAALGIERGQRVAFLGLNQPMFFFVMFAAARLGAIFVPLNFRLTGPELAFMVDDCAARALIADAQLRPVIAPQRERLKSLKAFLAAEDQASWTKPPAAPTKPLRVDEDDVAMILYTSGTTGRPKGAMLTHGNIWWNNANGMHALDCLSDDVTLTAAPVFHIGGLNVTTLVAWQKGALVVLHRAFDPGRVLAAIAAHKVTTMLGVPAMFLFMAQHPSFAGTDLSSVRLLIVGGAPSPLSLL
jgi:fatty-acyl-CoA synthase